MRMRFGRAALTVGLAGAATLLVVAPASARFVSGQQTIVDKAAGTYAMTGSLKGDWAITSFEEVATEPVYKAKGTERFNGCVDRDRDGSCRGEPKGKLDFKFRYWARFASDGSVQLGTCAHKITGGSGDFSHTAGFIQMVDTPTADPPYYFQTHYEGWIGLNRGHRGSRASASAASGHC